jgi:flagellar motor switch protein FliN/FliY
MPDQPRQEDIDELMKVLAASGAPVAEPAAPRKETSSRAAPAPVEYETLAPGGATPRASAGLEFLGDVDVQVRIELGRSRMNVQDVLKLGSGSVVPLDSLVGDPVNIYVNDRLVARGEVLVVRDRFAIRVTELLKPA